MRVKQFNVGDIVEVTIETIVPQGYGLGRNDGMVIFVTDTAPGDLVLARIFERKKNYAKAHLLEIVSPAKTRVEPRCTYAGRCGGCMWQHLPYAEQLSWKVAHITEEFRRKLPRNFDQVIQPIVGSPEQYGYRTRCDFHLGSVGGRAAIGFFKHNTNDLIPIGHCHLLNDRGNELLQAFAELLDLGKKTAAAVIKQQLQKVSIRTSPHDSDRLLLFQFNPALVKKKQELQPIWEEITAFFPGNVGIAAAPKQDMSRFLKIRPPYTLHEQLGKHHFQVSAQSFWQNNHYLHQQLIETIVAAATPTPDQNVVDLYSGSGAQTAFLAATSKQVWAIESNPVACRDAVRNTKAFGNVKVICGDATRELGLLAAEMVQLIYLDPPRNGLKGAVLAAVVEFAPRRIVYVSCNFTTLSRDLALFMESGYRPISVFPIDMFPQTPHVEVVVSLARDLVV